MSGTALCWTCYAHTIAKALLHFLTETLQYQGNITPRVELYIGERVDAIWPDCPPELQYFVPDGIIITLAHSHPLSKHPLHVVIFEFASCYMQQDRAHTGAGDDRSS
eukprot:3272547-Rhodomonas_salina.1